MNLLGEWGSGLVLLRRSVDEFGRSRDVMEMETNSLVKMHANDDESNGEGGKEAT